MLTNASCRFGLMERSDTEALETEQSLLVEGVSKNELGNTVESSDIP